MIGNSFLDRATGAEEYLEDGALLTAPTIFERAERHGVSSALLTSKKKTVSLLGKGATIRIAAEAPDAEIAARYGEAPPIYSREINYWLMRAAIDLLKTRPDLGVVYVHTTDYAMHMWPPEAEESQEHLAHPRSPAGRSRRGRARRGVPRQRRPRHELQIALLGPREGARRARRSHPRSPSRPNATSICATIAAWAARPGCTSTIPAMRLRVAAVLQSLDGVERVLTREQAAREFHLMASRIGDLVVLGDRDTVFGNLEQDEMEQLPQDYRSHGSLHESDVPLIIHNARNAPPAGYFRFNLDLARWVTRMSRRAPSLSARRFESRARVAAARMQPNEIAALAIIEGVQS